MLAYTLVALAGIAPAPPMTADQIMARVVARFDANLLAREGIEYTKTEVVSALEGDHPDTHFKERKRTILWDMWIDAGLVWQLKMVENGRMLRDQQPGHPASDTTSRIAQFFAYSLGEPAVKEVQGHPCWVVHFTSRGLSTELESNDEEVLSRSEGIFYVDQAGFWIRRVEGHLIRPWTKNVGGFLPAATVHSAFFTSGQQEVLGAIMPLYATMDLRYRKFFKTIHERVEYRYDGFRMRRR